ncbi:hypothetical protein F0225_18705 [Vibrio pectenicida]|uniref:Uncharacterized protein n=2 Tax=Vibrio pectenicida TaxID=62763 RepID=A0A7Y4A2H8_9VIBR|nr:hypothetical protein [Vibrio pectenicida]
MVKNTATNTYVQAGVALTASGSALAETPSNPSLAVITGAIESGKEMVGVTTSGLLGMAAIGFGVGMVLVWLARR